MKTYVRFVCYALLLLTACTVAFWLILYPLSNRNKLALGATYKGKPVDIIIQSPIELDGKTKSEVLNLRRSEVLKHPNLLAGEYTPSEVVFGQIVDGLPWWGIEGQFRNGSGQSSPEGNSEESRFILNPYLLVAADFYGSNTQPYTCTPHLLSWQPSASRAEAFYDAACIENVNLGPFDLIAYNARDLNLNYIYVDYSGSKNITHQNTPSDAFAIPHFIHQGGSCGYPGGCNNMSPRSPEIDGLKITALPAKIEIRLWRDKPSSSKNDPDMTFILRFE